MDIVITFVSGAMVGFLIMGIIALAIIERI